MALFRRGADPSAEPDHAWKVLSTTNEWIRHADAKTGVTLAFVGVTGTTLFNLARSEEQWSFLFNIAVLACLGTLVTAIVCAGFALFPRTKTREEREKFRKMRSGKKAAREPISTGEGAAEDQINLLFFGHVTAHYKNDGPSYQEVLRLITTDKDRLTNQIASQIHENSHVAVLKFKYVNRAIQAELAALACLLAAVVLVITGG